MFAWLLPDTAAAVYHPSESLKISIKKIKSTGNWAIKNMLKGFSVGTTGDDKNFLSGNNSPRC